MPPMVGALKELTMNVAITPAALRPEQAAQYLSLSVQRLARLRLEGRGPIFRKCGSSVIYIKSDLDEWLHADRRRSTSDGASAAA